MYHIIKQNGKDLLLCSGAMGEADYIMFEKEFGITKDRIKFVPQEVINLCYEPIDVGKLKDMLSKVPCKKRSLLQKASLIFWNIYGVLCSAFYYPHKLYLNYKFRKYSKLSRIMRVKEHQH